MVDSLVLWAHVGVFDFFIFCLFLLAVCSFLWWFDVTRESWSGFRSSIVLKGFRFGIIFFIISEIFLFFCFFWGYFHKCFRPSVNLSSWPPVKFLDILIDPFGMPFLKTVLLLSSGVRITLCHHCLLRGDRIGVVLGFFVTLFLGFMFLVIQFEEYRQRYFSLSSTIYGSIFFILTGFHGGHVIIGLCFIYFCFIRFLKSKDFSTNTMVRFEAAAWYWHFVDVVWIFLFIFLYVYGS